MVVIMQTVAGDIVFKSGSAFATTIGATGTGALVADGGSQQSGAGTISASSLLSLLGPLSTSPAVAEGALVAGGVVCALSNCLLFAETAPERGFLDHSGSFHFDVDSWGAFSSVFA